MPKEADREGMEGGLKMLKGLSWRLRDGEVEAAAGDEGDDDDDDVSGNEEEVQVEDVDELKIGGLGL